MIGNKKPIAADELGKLLEVMARDYRKLTRGRTLVVARFEIGSTWLWFQDAALLAGAYTHNVEEISRAINATRYFAESISMLWKYFRGERSTARMPIGRQPTGMKTVEKLAQIAADSNSKIDLSYQSKDAEKIEFRMTPMAAKKARERRQKRLSFPKAETPRQLESALRSLDFTRPDSAATVTEALAQFPSGSDARALASVVGNILRSAGLTDLLERIITELTMGGHHSLAMALRLETLKSREDQVSSKVARE